MLCDIHFSLGANASFTNKRKAWVEHTEAYFVLQKAICESIYPDFVDQRLALAYAELGDLRANQGQIEDCLAVFERERQIRDRIGVNIPLARDADRAWAYIAHGDLDSADKLLTPIVEQGSATGKEKESQR